MANVIYATVGRVGKLVDFERTDLRMLNNFVKMMVRDQFLGSTLGLIWAVATPVLMLGIFTFVFGFVFTSKLPGAETSLSFVIWLISGYGPWLATAQGLSAGTGAVVAYANLVKNLKFKTEILPMAGALTGMIPLLVAIVYLTILLAVESRAPTLEWLVMIPYLLLQFTFMIGIVLALSAANVFMRDVTMILPNLLLLIMFGSPIFYPLQSVPAAAQKVMLFNPFYLIAEGFRQPLLFGAVPPLWQTAYLLFVAAATFTVGLYIFRRFKPHFDSEL